MRDFLGHVKNFEFSLRKETIRGCEAEHGIIQLTLYKAQSDCFAENTFIRSSGI